MYGTGFAGFFVTRIGSRRWIWGFLKGGIREFRADQKLAKVLCLAESDGGGFL